MSGAFLSARCAPLLSGTPEQVTVEDHQNDEYLRYDLNGNITQLQRYAISIFSPTPELIDNLTYTYYGNKVVGIADDSQNPSGYEGGGGEIVYEQNGNMISMPDKGISNISYNFLNLPMQITQNGNTTYYLYRTDGVKLKKTFTLEGGSVINTEYLDGFQYSTPNTKPLRLALRQTDDATTSAVTAGEEQAFTSLADRAVIANKIVLNHRVSLLQKETGHHITINTITHRIYLLLPYLHLLPLPLLMLHLNESL